MSHCVTGSIIAVTHGHMYMQVSVHIGLINLICKQEVGDSLPARVGRLRRGWRDRAAAWEHA